MVKKIYTITSQVSSTQIDNGHTVEIYDAKSAWGGTAQLGFIMPKSQKDFSYPINSQILFSTACCVNGVLYQQKLTR